MVLPGFAVLELSLQWLTRLVHRPDVLWKTSNPLGAHQSTLGAEPKELERLCASKDLNRVAKRFVRTRRGRRCEPKVSGIFFMLRVATVAHGSSKTLPFIWVIDPLEPPLEVESSSRHRFLVSEYGL